MRSAIAALPDGVYRSAIDLDGFDDHPTHIACTITIAGEAMTVDYAGSSPQNQRATNCTMNYTQAYSIYPIKCVLDPYTRRNEGSYRPITVTAPEGSIINAKYPAAVAARHLSGHTLSCAIYQALAEVVPDRIIADSGGAPAMRARLGGVDDNGDRYSVVLFASAGMGASHATDGLSTTAFPTNSGAGSLEVLEAGSPCCSARRNSARIWRRGPAAGRPGPDGGDREYRVAADAGYHRRRSGEESGERPAGWPARCLRLGRGRRRGTGAAQVPDRGQTRRGRRLPLRGRRWIW
jgi:N-methylhydantoinase B